MIDLSVVLPAHGETALVVPLLTPLHQALSAAGCRAELLVVLTAEDGDIPMPAGVPARLVRQDAPGYGVALRAGFAAATGAWVLTHGRGHRRGAGHRRERCGRAATTPTWSIGSRYVAGGEARMPPLRRLLSRALNLVFGRGLSSRRPRSVQRDAHLPRPGRAGLARRCRRTSTCCRRSWSRSTPRAGASPRRRCSTPPLPGGRSHARAWRFAADYARTFWRLWKLRNSIECADYDARAHDSVIPLQRYWQRSRFRHVTDLIAGQGPVLDVGCGSSLIIGALPAGSVAVDVLLRKLRYDRRFGRPRVQGSGFSLPFADASFPCVLCSQVIEHVPKESPILGELVRVLRPGGRLVLGTPDYANWEWVATEWLYGKVAPGAYADEHIAHYTREELIGRFAALGFTHEATRYILRGELILAFRKAN